MPELQPVESLIPTYFGFLRAVGTWVSRVGKLPLSVVSDWGRKSHAQPWACAHAALLLC